MTLNTLQYRNKPVRFEVVELTLKNVDEVARWCGGTRHSVFNILNNQDCPQDTHTHSLQIPSIYGGIEAEIGTFIAKNLETGAFSVMTREHLESEYERAGVRSEGLTFNGFPRLGGN
jgi:hypothetical protein